MNGGIFSHREEWNHILYRKIDGIGDYYDSEKSQIQEDKVLDVFI
jgi:hypothetical protein